MRKKGIFIIFLSVIVTVILFLFSKDNVLVVFQKPLLSFSQISALLGTIFFCYAFFLASRFSFLENIFGGLDKVYKLHQITGRVCFILLISHFIFLVSNYIGSSVMLSLLILPGKNLSYNFGIFSLWSMCLILSIILYMAVDYQWLIRIQRFFIIPFTLGVLHMVLIPSDFSRYLPLAIFLSMHIAIGYISWVYRVLLYPFIGPRFEYEIESLQVYPNDVIVISMVPLGKKMAFLPGQFTYVRFEGIGIKKESHPFSIASSPFDSRIRLAIKAYGDFTTQVKTLKIGEKAFLTGPYGKFSERFFFENKDSVCIAGGIGITPFLGMINYLKDSKLPETKNLHLFYSIKNESDNVFAEELKRISYEKQNLSLKFIHTERDGRLSARAIQNALGEIKEKLYFLCGPKMMMEDLSRQLKKMSIPAGNIIFEDFSYQ